MIKYIISHLLVAVLVGGGIFLYLEKKYKTEIELKLTAQVQQANKQNEGLEKKVIALDTLLQKTLSIDEAICWGAFDKVPTDVLAELEKIKLATNKPPTKQKTKKGAVNTLMASVSRVKEHFGNLSQKVFLQQQFYEQLNGLIQLKLEALESIPAIIPNQGRLASGFGFRRDPIEDSLVKFHKGLDIAAPTGTPIFAAAAGTISLAETQGGYGNCIEIQHSDEYLTRYGHLSKIDVKTGQKVKRGQYIGEVGSIGRSTGAHCHYEVHKNGTPINPISFVGNVSTTRKKNK